METYAAFLRGINVGGHWLIRMEDLRELLTRSGLVQVRSYLQSGNMVFRGQKRMKEEYRRLIDEQIRSVFGFEVFPVVLTVGELLQIVAANPFLKDPSKSESHLHVVFFEGETGEINPGRIDRVISPGEEVVATGRTIYQYCPGGYGKTRLTNLFFEKLMIRATTRNWKTTCEVLKMMQQ